MPYFRDHHSELKYPPLENGVGLYNAQIGAIHAIGSHFTLERRPAVVTMPTGSGKTAVLMMVPFQLRSERVLVITPSRLVRGQIADEFSVLKTLKDAGVLRNDIPLPKVIEVKNRIRTGEDWEALKEFDVVVSTPNCVSPGYLDVPQPPANLFDLLLIDEAHHSPSRTWTELLEAFEGTPRVLFTATPFRRDRGEINGLFIYTYPVLRAFQDGIFGPIGYVQVDPAPGESHDVAVVRRTAAIFAEDRAAARNHYVMVRTDRRARADELLTVYEQNTNLRLKVIHSGHSNRAVKQVLSDLGNGTLDGIICVDMLGEGFNFPRLKIAAIHSPHRSLAITLQFIGRFARTNAPDIGAARFIAVPSDIEIEGKKLFADRVVWQEIVPDLSHGRIAEEIQVRQVLQEFREPERADTDLADLSLYSLYPRSHVKIFSVPEHINLAAVDMSFGSELELRYRNVNQDGNVVVMITRNRARPKWSATDDILNTAHDLFVVYYYADTRLLFINSSRSVDGLYDVISRAYSPDAKPLASGEVGRVVRNIANKRVFNVGMRNILATNKAESYKILAGSDTQEVITKADGRKYAQGHVFLSGEENGTKTTVGYSSGSKVWAASIHQIPELLEWCRRLGQKIRRNEAIVTQTGLDHLATGKVVDAIPDHIVYGQWHGDAFDANPPVQVEYTKDDGTPFHGLLLDLDLEIDRQRTDANSIVVNVQGDGLVYPVRFTLANFYESVDGRNEHVQVVRGQERSSLIEYLNEFYLDFFTGDGGVFFGTEVFQPPEAALPIDIEQIEIQQWAGVNIQNEVRDTQAARSIQSEIRRQLEAGDAGVIVHDHGTGEVADFITVAERQGTMSFVLFHCKGSGGARPGARVNDVYEVCGQAQKSVAFANLARLEKRLRQRRNRSRYVRGTFDELMTLLVRAKDMRHRFEIVVVQPGISRGGLTPPLAEALGATNGHLVGAGVQPLRIWASG
jgi:superfamily II DNA or RNA helicase